MAVWNVINRSEFRSHTNIMAEHYQLERIDSENRLKQMSSYKIGDLYKQIIQLIGPSKLDGRYDVYDLTDSISNFLTTDKHFLKASSAKKLSQKDDFIISRLRSYLMEMAVIPDCDYKVALSTEYLVYRSKTDISAKILLPFALSSYVQSILKWAQMGNEHPRFASETFESIYLPNIIINHAKEIDSYIDKAIDCHTQSIILYRRAEELFAKELQLDQLHIPTKKWYTALYSEVIDDNRMNAEYFSPAVKSILNQGFLQGGYTIGDLFHIVRGYTPKSYYESGVPVIKTKSVRMPSVDKKRITDYADIDEPLALTREHDLILAAMGVGSLGRTSYVTADDSDCAIDGTLRVLRRKNESLSNIEIPTMMFLATTVGQKLIYRGITGTTGIISLPDEYLTKIPVPMLDESIRNNITKLVLDSIEAKSNSEQLLAQAKHRVEELIEQEANKYK